MNILKEYNDYYTANEKPEVVEIGEASYISIIGE